MSQHLADYYSNPDLQEQARQTLAYIQDFLAANQVDRDGRIVDLGCGIGSLAVGLAQAGWSEIYGIEHAEPMLEIARQHASQSGAYPHFEVADMMTWRSETPVAVMTCFDVLNHLLEASDVQALFRHVWQQLQPGGYWLFDVNTRENFASPIWNYENRELGSPAYRMCLNGRFDEATGRVYAQTLITMETPDGPQTMDNTLMCQYYASDDLSRWLAEAGFAEPTTFGYSPMDLTQVIPGLEYTKTRFECRKPG